MPRPEPDPVSRLALTSFLLSLSSIVLGPLGFIPAILCGHLANRRLPADPPQLDRNLARGGLIIGYAFFAIYLLLAAAFVVFDPMKLLSGSSPEERKIARAMEDLEGLHTLFYHFHEKRKVYPTNEEGLAVFTDPAAIPDLAHLFPGFGPSRIIDPWGNPYRYASPGTRNPATYDLWSLGPDGLDGTADDIIDR